MGLGGRPLIAACALVVTVALAPGFGAGASAASHRTGVARFTPLEAAKPAARLDPRRSSAEHRVLLDGPHSGRAALRRLDARGVSAAAARNGMSTARLRSLVQNDSTVWLARDGKVFFRDTATAAEVQASAQVAAAAPAWATFPTADSLTLHSKPGSKHTIYLDFDGYTLGSGQYWTSNGIPAGTYGGFSLDGNTAAFTDTELDYVQTVWRIVAEKYSPFDVDVTTEAPATTALNRSS